MIYMERQVVVEELKVPEHIFGASVTQFIDGSFWRTAPEFATVDLGNTAKRAVERTTPAVNHQIRKT